MKKARLFGAGTSAFSLLVLCLFLVGCRIGGPAPASTASGIRCGTERWPVKTMSDQDAGRVDLTPQPATVTALRALPAPLDLPRDRRNAPTELQVYTVRAQIMEFKLESDHDVHVVLTDPDDPRATLIAELADVACSGAIRSSVAGQMQAARAAFIARYGQPESSFRRVEGLATVTGVGFFDSIHGQAGVAPNGIELHPVLAIKIDR